ncbi:SDR family NAD(P)-dependent oxidoreductase [Rhodococcus sp. NPDC059968]|uniref:SDR family NAD(P)-dependent oxidoreductase n=1 Tax=Rhodococcus sp. NPDC059968 TaxID=3347017 RepID=UPI00366E947D
MGMLGQGANSNYCAAKGGIFGLTRALALEGTYRGIEVYLVFPYAPTITVTDSPIRYQRAAGSVRLHL